MKVCIFTHQYLPRIGGVQVLVENLVNYLVEISNCEVVLIGPYYSSTEPEVESKEGLTIYRLFNPDLKWTVLKAFKRFVEVLKKEKPDIVHGQDALIDNAFCFFANIKTKIPYVISTQGELNALKRETVPLSAKLKIPYLKLVLSRPKYIIASESKIMNELEKRVGYSNKYCLLINAIYVNRSQLECHESDFHRLKELNLQPHKFFVFLGRLVYDKGIFDLVEAIALKKDLFETEGYKFYFSGEGADKQKLRQIIKKYDLGNLILLSDEIRPNDKWALLHQARAMVLASWEENLPISILESFGVGTPVIGSDIKEIENLIPDKNVGEVFKLKDPVDLSKVLESFIKSKKVKSPESFKKAMVKHDLLQMGHEVIDLYSKAIKQPDYQ